MVNSSDRRVMDAALAHNLALVVEREFDENKLLRSMEGAQTVLLEQLEQKHDNWLSRLVDHIRPGRVDHEDARLIKVARFAAEQEDMAIKDPMTGLYNKAFLKEHLLKRMSELSRRHDNSAVNPGLVLLTIDLDNFKAVNDIHGHPAGDEAIVTVANILKKLTRTGDVVARLGGDEFAVLMNADDVIATRDHLTGSVEGQSDHTGTIKGSWVRKVNDAIVEELGSKDIWQPVVFDQVKTYFTYGADYITSGVLQGSNGQVLTRDMEKFIKSSDDIAKDNKVLRKAKS